MSVKVCKRCGKVWNENQKECEFCSSSEWKLKRTAEENRNSSIEKNPERNIKDANRRTNTKESVHREVTKGKNNQSSKSDEFGKRITIAVVILGFLSLIILARQGDSTSTSESNSVTVTEKASSININNNQSYASLNYEAVEGNSYVSETMIDLATLEPYRTSHEGYFSSKVTDNLGNEHLSGLHGGVRYGKYDDGVYNLYYINSQYTTLTGTMVVRFDDRDDNGTATVIISGDNTVLMQESYTADMKPKDFSIDVSNVEDLKIELYGDYGMQACICDVYLNN